MVTLIDNLELNDEERKWYEKIVRLPPIATEIRQWINLEEIIDGINDHLEENEIHVVVATGGVEVYQLQDNNPNVFVFESPNFGSTNQPTFELDFEEYKKITENPVKYHEREIQRLGEYLAIHEHRKVSVIEGDIGNRGLSAARLCAIYQSVKEVNPTKIFIGAAPKGNIFSVLRRSSLYLLSGDGFYKEDLRKILGLGTVPYKIIVPCEEGYIRRASEILGVSRLADVNADIIKWEEFYKTEGILSGSKLIEYSNWFRHLTLKKINRVSYVNKRIEQLKSDKFS